VRRDEASPANRANARSIQMSFLSIDSLQNKQCFHNLHAYLSAARNKQDHGSVMSIGERGRDHGRIV
jgi:hypothetical protein